MSYKQATTLATFTASGDAITGPCIVENFHLAAGSDAATVVVRDGGVNGPIRAKLAAVAGGNDDLRGCFRFTQSVYITVTGTSPVFTVGIQLARANQVNPS